jgi:hypothetical protein
MWANANHIYDLMASDQRFDPELERVRTEAGTQARPHSKIFCFTKGSGDATKIGRKIH